jgi:hypothetical protein
MGEPWDLTHVHGTDFGCSGSFSKPGLFVIDRRGDVALIGASTMDKRQEIVDAVFGAVNNQPAPQPPNEFTVQRQRVFDESARKIEALRRARLEQKASQ